MPHIPPSQDSPRGGRHFAGSHAHSIFEIRHGRFAIELGHRVDDPDERPFDSGDAKFERLLTRGSLADPGELFGHELGKQCPPGLIDLPGFASTVAKLDLSGVLPERNE